MYADALIKPLDPGAYASLLPLVPEESWSLGARATLLAGMPGVYADDAHQPTVVAVDVAAPGGRSVFLFGGAEHPALPDFIRVLTGPATLRAGEEIADRLPTWRPDVMPRGCATFTFPADGADATYAVLPPGGVRRLRPADARHLAAFPVWLWAGYASAEAMLREGVAYARYLRAELVSIACIGAATERFDGIAVYTIERTRRNGFARECAHRLIGAIVNERGKLPVLTTSAENDAALGLARSLGMTARRDQMAYEIA
jgi:hypothetical protein